MTYTIGTSHAISGSGSFVIDKPVGLKIAVTGIPVALGARFGPPLQYTGLGGLSLGNADGYLSRREIVHASQLEYPLPDGLTVCAYDLVATAAALVYELVAVADPHTLQPWDRNAAFWSQYYTVTLVGGTAPVTPWTYTVPTGKWLRLEYAEVSLVRVAAATTNVAVQNQLLVAAQQALNVRTSNNVVSERLVDQLVGPLDLPAGTVVAGFYVNSDTAGNFQARGYAAGLLFDA